MVPALVVVASRWVGRKICCKVNTCPKLIYNHLVCSETSLVHVNNDPCVREVE